MDATSLLGEVSHLVPALLSKQDVICLDSSGDEDEKVDPTLPALAIRDGKIFDTLLFFLNVSKLYVYEASSFTVTAPVVLQM